MVSLLQQLLHICAHKQGHSAKRGRGRPADFSLEQVWLALLVGMLTQVSSMRIVWRSLVSGPIGTFPALGVTYEAVRSRLLSASIQQLQSFFEQIRQALLWWQEQFGVSALSLANFAPRVVALDETSLDELKRLTEDLRAIPDADPQLRPGKLAGLFDLRLQQWVRLQFRADVPAGCNIGILSMLEGLQRGSLILADLGYFGFPWFDYLTEMGYCWISRLKAKTSYTIHQVFYEDTEGGVLDALIWLGAYRADKAAYPVRLVQYYLDGITYQYLTNVLDPVQLPLVEVARLYARRWDVHSP